MKSNKTPFIPVLARVVVSFALFAGSLAQAATDTWTGASSTDFSVGANYVGSPTITTGDTLVFGSTSGSGTSLTDAGTLSLGGIVFNSGALAYTLAGNSLTLTGGITNNSTSLETIGNAIVINAAQTFAMNTGGITLGGIVSGTGGGITTTGTGTLTLSATGNSYTGATTIDSGTVDVTGTLTGGGALDFNGTGTFIAANTFTVGGLDLTSGLGTVSNTTSGKTLTLGTITRSPGSMVDFVITDPIKTTVGDSGSTGIIGPWAFTGTGTSLSWAVDTGAAGTSTNITALTTFTGTNTTTSLVATGNYKYTAGETLTNQTANTLQWGAGTAAGTLTISGKQTLNGLMNTGTGLLTVTGGDLVAGSTGEIDIITDSKGITIASEIINPTTGTTSVVIGGPQGTTGTVTYTTSQGYTGNTTIDSGTLNVGGGGSVFLTSQVTGGTSTINIANAGTLDFNSSHGNNINYTITGSGNLVINDVGTAGITLPNANTFTGTTTLDSNFVEITNGGTLAGSNFVMNGDALLQDGNTTGNTGVNSLTLNAGLGMVSNSNTSSSNNVFAVGAVTRTAGSGSMVDFVNTSTGTGGITTTSANDATGILGTWAFYGTGANLSYATVTGGVISALTYTAGITLDNSGTLALVNSATGNYSTGASSNTNTGAITANTLQFDVTGAASWTNTGGATLNGLMNSGTGALTESGGTITIGASQELDIVTNTLGITIGSVIADNGAGSSSLVFGSVAGTGTISTPLSGGGLTLTGVNTYTGNTYINSGALTIGGAGQLDSGIYAGAIAIGPSAQGSATVGTAFDYNSSAAQTLSGIISGSGALNEMGSGTLTLTNNGNTYTGGTGVAGGTLILANTAVLAASNVFTVGTGGDLQLGNSNASYTTDDTSLIFTGNGEVTNGTTGTGTTATLALSNITGSNTGTGGVIQIASGATGTIGAGVILSSGNQTYDIDAASGAVGGTLDVMGFIDGSQGSKAMSIDDVTVNILAGGTIVSGNFQINLETGGIAKSYGIVNVDGGTLNMTTESENLVLRGGGSAAVGGAGATVLTVSQGGLVETSNVAGGDITVGVAAGSTSAVYLDANGTIETGGIITQGGTSNFIFNGGTLEGGLSDSALSSPVDFMAGLTAAYIGGNNGSGGAVIDPNGFDLTIGQALLTSVGASGATLTVTTDTGLETFQSTTTGSIDGGLDVTGSGTLTLTNALSTYNGGTTITGATLALAPTNSATTGTGILGSTGDFTINGGGILDIDNIAETLGVATLDGGAIQSTGSTSSAPGTLTVSSVDVSGGTNTINSDVNVDVTGSTTVNTGTLAVDGEITESTGAVAVGGSGTLAGTGTVNGNTTLTGTGIINFSNPGNITGTLSVTGGNWNGAGSVTGLVTSSSGNFNIGSGANLTATGGVNVTGGTISSSDSTGTITGGLDYTSSASSTFAGVIAGTGALTLDNSAATLTLTGTSTYTGGTIINAGTLAMANASSSGFLGGGDLTVNGGGILDLEGTTQTVDGLNGTGTITNLFTDGRAETSSLIVGNGDDSGSFSGSIQDGALSNTSLTKEGAGTQVLSGESQYSGGTTITGGILSISSEDNIGNASGYFASIGFTPDVTLGGGELLTTATTPITEDVQLDTGTTNTLAAATGTTATYSGVVADTSVGNPGALNVGDSHGNNGTVVLSNANTYTGGTTVSSGTLEVANGTNGSATGSGALTVESTGTLVGIGTTVSSSFSISGNVIAGSGLASDTTGQTVIEGSAALHNSSFANATLSFNLDSSSRNSTSINVGATGVDFRSTVVSLTFQGSNIVAANTPYVLIAGDNSSDLAGVDGSQYEGIMTDTSGADGLLAGQYKITGGLSLFFENEEALYGANSFLFLNTLDGVDDIEVEVIPEPGTWALMLGGLALLVFWQRRKNQE